MDKGRLEAFSDGVIAIIITIVVLVIDPPDEYDHAALVKMVPVVLMYTVSFFMIGLNWVNHHHLMRSVENVNGKILWVNLLYLFMLSFTPVMTGWVGKSRFASVPLRCYAIMYFLTAMVYILLEHVIVAEKSNRVTQDALLDRTKEKISAAVGILAVILSFIQPVRYLSILAMLFSTAIWVIPDRRMEHMVSKNKES